MILDTSFELIQSFYLSVLFLVVLNLIIIFLWRNIFFISLTQKLYDSSHKIHTGVIPKLGGLVFFLAILSLNSFSENHISVIDDLLLILIPVFIISLYEDIFNNSHPYLRILFKTISIIFFFSFVNFNHPIITIPIINFLFESSTLMYVFFLVLCLLVLSNGFNMLDGLNGHLILIAISILCSLLFLAAFVDDSIYNNVFLILIIFLISQLIFNFPFPMIFFGDLGAYSLGMLIGFLTIMFFGQYNNLLTWYAVLLLIYPAYEVLFSVVRRFKNGQSIMKADLGHLHNTLFTFLVNNNYSRLLSNNLSTLFLIPLTSFPFFWICVTPKNNLLLIFCGIFLFVLIYHLYFIAIKKLSK